MNTNLDITTPNGREAFQNQLLAMQIVFRNANGAMTFAHTGGEDAAPCDGFIIKGGFVTSIGEVKSRDMTVEHLRRIFKNEWLVTKRKLDDLSHMSFLLCVRSWGFLFCVPSRIVLAVLLCEKDGKIVCPHRVEITETKESCNGGLIKRRNAFINMKDAVLYQ